MAASRTAAARADPEAPAAGPSPELTALGLSFRRLFRAVTRMRGRDTHLAVGEISHAQFELMIELEERGELSAGELAVAARIAPATVTQMLDGLAESGYVRRRRSDSDRRVVLASLTELGRARVQIKRTAWQARWEAALGDVSARELRAAARVLSRLGDMFENEPSDPGCGDPREG